MKNIASILLVLFFSVSVFSQKTISGIVKDDNGDPLTGATILEKNAPNGTTADFDGNFELTLRTENPAILVSFVGFKTKEVTIGDAQIYNIQLEVDSETLEEIVVIGYGSVSKKDLTGSVSTVKNSEVITQQSRGIESMLQGRATGVQVSANGSEPGASVSIKIRGMSSLTSNSQPLYVVDGVIMDSATEDTEDPLGGYTPPQGGLSGVNPADIETVQILKDASATAIYGSRAANGVIIITTKKGVSGKAKFTATTMLSVGNVVRNIDVLDIEGYVNYQNDVKAFQGFEPAYTINPDGSIYTTGDEPVLIKGIDWAEDTYRAAIIQNTRLSVSGGSDNGNYFLSGGIVKNQGTFPRSEAQAIDFNINVDQNLNDRLKLGTKITTTYTELNSSRGTDGLGGTNNSMVRQVILAAPIENLAENNQDAEDIDETLDGPRAWTTDYDDNSTEVRVLGKIDLQYKISDSFTYKLLFGGDYRSKERSFWYGTALRKGQQSNGEAGISTLNRFRYNIDNTLMYRKSFNRDHRLNGTIGYLIDKTSISKTRYSAVDFADKSLRADGISYGATNTPLVISSEYPTIISFIGRLNYTFKNRYLITGTFRADGSSRFSEGNRWGYFPAVSFAWKLDKENFMDNATSVSELKVRLGYGEVGNQNIPSYSFLSSFVKTESGLADAEGGNTIAVVPSVLVNPDLKWETAVQYNAGIDFGFFDNRLTGTLDSYYKTSSDLLLKVAVGPTTGFDFMTANQGNIENRGLELSLSGDIIRNEDWNWNVFANISMNKTKIGKLGIDPGVVGALGEQVSFLGTQVSGGTYFKQPANIFIEGREAGLFYGLETKGIIRTDEELTDTESGDPLTYKGDDLKVGDVYFVDQNNDGDITDADKTIIGNPNPDFTYGMGTTVQHKNLTLSIMMNGVHGNDIANGNLLESDYANHSTKNIRTRAYVNAFDPVTNPNGTYPYVGVGYNVANYTEEFNDRIVEDGSFLRLSYVSLGYDFPTEVVPGIDKLTLTASGQNLFIWTDYSGFDPEVNSFAYDPTRSGIDWGSFPNQRTFSLGLNLTF